MAYTSTDLTNIEAAIIALARGQRAVRVQIGDKLVQYSEAQLSELIRLKSDIQAALGTFSFRTYAKNGGRGR